MKYRAYVLAIIAVAGLAAGREWLTNPAGEGEFPALPVVEAAEEEEAWKKPIEVEQQQIMETAELMKILVDPTYETLKDAIENPPEKRRDWRSLYIAAFNLAELNNLNFSRRDQDYMSTKEWIEHSITGRDLCVKLAISVREQADYETLKANYLAVVKNCNDCHTAFAPGEIDKIEPPLSWSENAAGEKEDIPL